MEDHIERLIELNAAPERVWRALTDPVEFGSWFRVALDGPFKLGEVTRGVITHPGHEGLPFWLRVEIIDRPRLFSFAWPVDESVAPEDPDLDGKVTVVEFHLDPLGSRTRLTIRERGFAKLPASTRLQTFRDNQTGWDIQSENIRTYLE